MVEFPPDAPIPPPLPPALLLAIVEFPIPSPLTPAAAAGAVEGAVVWMPPPEEAARFPDTVDHETKFDPVPLRAIPPPSAPDRLSATVEWSILSPVPKMAPPEPPALLSTARTLFMAPRNSPGLPLT